MYRGPWSVNSFNYNKCPYPCRPGLGTEACGVCPRLITTNSLTLAGIGWVSRPVTLSNDCVKWLWHNTVKWLCEKWLACLWPIQSLGCLCCDRAYSTSRRRVQDKITLSRFIALSLKGQKICQYRRICSQTMFSQNNIRHPRDSEKVTTVSNVFACCCFIYPLQRWMKGTRHETRTISSSRPRNENCRAIATSIDGKSH